MKNTLEVINSKLDGSEEQIGDLGGRVVEIFQIEQKIEKKIFLNEDSWKLMWNQINHPNIYIIVVPEGEERQGQNSYLKK